MRILRRKPALSIVVVAYKMSRELPRTLVSLSRQYQRNIGSLDYEVLVIDNGSPEPVERAMVEGIGREFRLHRIDSARTSPAHAANQGVTMTHGRNVALILDGARIITPGVLSAGLTALRTHDRSIVTTIAWHLGIEHQSLSIPKGYGPVQEDALLDGLDWPNDGYGLFDIAALAGANPGGFLGRVNESCCLLLPRTLWDETGGLDERFDQPGGGLVSLDLFTRLVALPESQLVVLLGEGSFHQVHGGASTSPEADHAVWNAEYKAIRGHPYTLPEINPVYYGAMAGPAYRWITHDA